MDHQGSTNVKFTRKAGGALALLILAVAGTWAAEVADVRFEQQGAQILSPEQIELNVQLHKGSQYTREILDEDVLAILEGIKIK